jgi:hypothetical protein
MYEYEAIQERIRERSERKMREAGAERMAREARGRRQRRRRRFAMGAAFGIFQGARRQRAA